MFECRFQHPLISLFTEDVIWDAGDFGKYEGKETLRAFFKEIPNSIKFTYHYFTNGIIKVEGDKADARWYILGLYTEADGKDTMLVGYEDDKYKKIDGKWLISEMKLVPGFYTPFKEGWSPMVMQ